MARSAPAPAPAAVAARPVAWLSPEFFDALAPRLSGYDAACLAMGRLRPAPGYVLPQSGPLQRDLAPACGAAGFYRLEVLTRGRWHSEASACCRLDLARWARVGFPGRAFRVVPA